MKKKTVKKLELAKETVRRLAGDEIQQAVAGGFTSVYPCEITEYSYNCTSGRVVCK